LTSISGRFRPTWDLVLVASFVVGSAWVILPSLVYPGLVGSHAVLYTHAAEAMVTGSDPWSVGPPIFAGPPTMPLSFLPWVATPDLFIRASWIAIDVVVAVWAIRKARLPGYWIAFPPLVQTIVLGHPEVLLLGLILIPRAASGLAILVKPYAIFPLMAERRWRAIALAVGLVLITAPVLPWARFFEEITEIIGTIVRQNNGDSAFGDPLATTVGVIALLSLGLRRALWLAVPVLWPYAQPNYKVMTMPAIAPVLAVSWALPIPGLTLAGVVVLATLVMLDRWRPLPAWLQAGINDNARFAAGEWQIARPLPAAPLAGAA
jgi:hypothetical protein